MTAVIGGYTLINTHDSTVLIFINLLNFQLKYWLFFPIIFNSVNLVYHTWRHDGKENEGKAEYVSFIYESW